MDVMRINSDSKDVKVSSFHNPKRSFLPQSFTKRNDAGKHRTQTSWVVVKRKASVKDQLMPGEIEEDLQISKCRLGERNNSVNTALTDRFTRESLMKQS